MANTILTTDLISNYTLAKFVNENPFVHTASRATESDFQMASYKIGDTVNIRRQNRFLVGDGQVATRQNYVETTELLTIDHQFHILIEFSSKDLTLSLDRFGERFVDPAVRHIINKMEVALSQQAAQRLNFFEGTAGTPISSFGSVDAAMAKLLEMAVPLDQDAYCALGVRDGASLKNSLSNFFNPTLNEDITQYSALGRLSCFDMFQSQNIYRQQAGNPGAGPITVSSTITSGNSIPMTGLNASTLVFAEGDLFSVAGVTSINPLSFQSTQQNMQFVVSQDIVSDGAGNATVFVNPAIVSDLGNPTRNVSNPILSGSLVTPVPSSNRNIAYIKRGLDLVCPPLDNVVIDSSVKTDPDTKVSIRLAKQGDIYNDVCAYRLDVLCGFLWHPQYAIQLIS